MKPGNIFLDSEGNIKLGDFGLATRHREKSVVVMDDGQGSEAVSVYNAIDDISRLMGGSSNAASYSAVSGTSDTGESMTGGVGTTFYRGKCFYGQTISNMNPLPHIISSAPEQEGRSHSGDGSYDVKADMFSFGIILFEIFHPPFRTYMERAETLKRIRGDQEEGSHQSPSSVPPSITNSFADRAKEKLPLSFVNSVSESAQRYVFFACYWLGVLCLIS